MNDVEASLLQRLREHQSATVDDLFDSLPNDELKCLVAGVGRRAIRTSQRVWALKRVKQKPVDSPLDATT